MSTVEQFLTPEEEKAVVAAIQDAEKATSGEIRVHLEKTLDKVAMVRALEVFHQLNMTATPHLTEPRRNICSFARHPNSLPFSMQAPSHLKHNPPQRQRGGRPMALAVLS